MSNSCYRWFSISSDQILFLFSFPRIVITSFCHFSPLFSFPLPVLSSNWPCVGSPFPFHPSSLLSTLSLSLPLSLLSLFWLSFLEQDLPHLLSSSRVQSGSISVVLRECVEQREQREREREGYNLVIAHLICITVRIAISIVRLRFPFGTEKRQRQRGNEQRTNMDDRTCTK